MPDHVGAEADPHVLVSARLRHNPKVIHLPSDGARWGWVVVLSEAKLQRPPGRFASRRVLDQAIGRYARFVPDYEEAGFLHCAPQLCERCRIEFPDARTGEYVVHDWRRHQERTSRSQDWRNRNGIPSGHVNKGGGETTGETGGETEGTPSRVGARSQSQSQSTEQPDSARDDEPEGEAITWLANHGCFLQPSSGYYRALILTVEQHGINAVVGMLDRLAGAGVRNGDAKGFVFGTKDALDARTRPNLKALEREDRSDELSDDFGRRVARTKVRAHDNGYHADERDPGCPRCREVA